MENSQLSYLKGPRTTKNDGLTVVDIFRRQARTVPEMPAVVYKNISVTYRDFDRLTDLLAVELIRQGIPRGGRVGILADRNELAPLSVLAVMKAGAVYVPLNPRYPPSRLEYMIQDAGITHLITNGHEDTIPGYKGAVINGRKFMDTPPEPVSVSASMLPVPVPGDIMLIEYTSGSTGNPKGVMLIHGNAMDSSEYYRELTGLSAGDAVSSYASLSFLMHLGEFFPAFMAGAAIHIIDDAIRLDTEAVNAYFEKHHITTATLPFSFGYRFVSQVKNHSLRSLIMGGENFTPLPDLPLGYTVYNGYGCTECCGGITIGEIKNGESRINVGTPGYNADIYMVDEQGGLVKRGEKGELCVSGPMVSAGYLNLDKKTAEVFITNPFSKEPGHERFYRTGDMARITEEGNIEIVGRVDFQIKIRGYRIEPAEIDACVRRYPGVLESVTVATENKADVKHLVTYIVAESRIEPALLRDFISGYLPRYMVPHFIEQLDKLPRNMNGKVDRASLPPPSVSSGPCVPPETEMEKKIARLWAIVLGLEERQISRDADFFDMGGDSLRAMILSIEISKDLKTDVSPAMIFKSSILKEQAAVLSAPESSNKIYVYSDAHDEAPLFFVHGGNIGPEAYAPLAAKLPADRAFYCFENYNIYNPDARIDGIVSLAGKYIEFLKTLVPQGPYTLGGWSFGGVVAFEMALQLEMRGETVKKLYLLDPGLVCGDEEKQMRKKLLDINNYQEYLSKDPLFERFRNMGFLKVLIENNRKISLDVCNYLPVSVYRGEVVLFKAIKPDPINPSVSAETFDVIRCLQVIAGQKKANGFDRYAPNLRVIEIPEIHDRFMQGEALDTIVSVIKQG
jgi:amino acid adenylation domain-containing protein